MLQVCSSKYSEELKQKRPAGNLDERSLFPGFGFHAGHPMEIQRATLIPENLVTKVASKVVRGIEYIQKASGGPAAGRVALIVRD